MQKKNPNAITEVRQAKDCTQDRVPPLQELVSQITKDNRYKEISNGPPRGHEIVEW
jgi:hypothetical protein